MSPLQWPSFTERERKGLHLEEPSLTLSVNSEGCQQSPSKCLSKTDDQASFTGPASTSTPNKTESGLCPRSCSNDGRCSMTPFETALYGSFSYPSGTGMRLSSITAMTSVARLQQVTSSRWQPTGSFSPLLPQAVDTLKF